ncbi:Probable 39S ribosomal protein L23, mitochondrial [Gryllus bimaculatus]|nr:Probable 39S ribosomal protein L23, mitochondrial [Gryllus bimaculatus]
MSTRWYPIYKRGSPQLRVFLPNFWIKLIRPVHKQPPNVVQFVVSVEMTKHDVKNYLEKIYNVPVVQVFTRIVSGETRQDPGKGYVVKDDDYKLAYVTLPQGKTFEFPELYPKEEESEQDKTQKELKKHFKNFVDRNKDRPGAPGWFSF